MMTLRYLPATVSGEIQLRSRKEWFNTMNRLITRIAETGRRL